jgi:hypothetical protein
MSNPVANSRPPVPQPPGAAAAAPAVLKIETFGQKPEDLDVPRNNEPTNDFQAKTVELKNQRPQWITYYQYVYIFSFKAYSKTG